MKSRKVPYFAIPGSDPNATLKGDHEQQVPVSTAPDTKPHRPKPVRSGGAYALKRERRRKP
jgi:hypothetical protein